MRRFPNANELVHDNYNFFVIGYGPSERPSGALISIAAGPLIRELARKVRRRTDC